MRPINTRARLFDFDKASLYLLLAITFAGFAQIPSLLVYAGLVIYVLVRPAQALLVLLLTFAINLGAPPLFPASDLAGRWLILFVVLAVTLFTGRLRLHDTATISLLILFSYLLVSGYLFSKMPVVSVLKAIALGALVLSVLGNWKSDSYQAVERQLTTVFAYLIGASLLIFLVGKGFERNVVGFQGAFVHPQVMGSFASIASAWFIGRWLLQRQVPRLDKLLGVLSLLMLVGSQSRTGLFGLLLGYVLMVIAAPLAGRDPRSFLPRAGITIVILFALIISFSLGNFAQRAEDFIKKGDEVNLALDDILVASRGDLMASSMENFRKHPIFGIGLGVPSFYESVFVERFVVRIAGIPVSATVEKGFLPTAVLEEVGIVGAFLLLILLFAITVVILRHGHAWVIWVYLVAMLQNGGEAVLLSPGGKGLLIWIITGFCYTIALLARQHSRLRESQYVRRPHVATLGER